MAQVFGSFEVSEVQDWKMVGEVITAARRDGCAQFLVRKAGDVMDSALIKDGLELILKALQQPDELLTLDCTRLDNLPSEDERTQSMLVCVITSSAGEGITPLMSYVAQLTHKLKDATREDAHRVIDRIAVLMSLLKHRGNRTFVAKELHMGRALVTKTIKDILLESGIDRSILPTRRKHIPRKKP